MIKKIVLILFIIGLSIIFYENYYIGSSYPIKIKESNKDNIKRVLYEFINIRKIRYIDILLIYSKEIIDKDTFSGSINKRQIYINSIVDRN
jgi:hypothetical protein